MLISSEIHMRNTNTAYKISILTAVYNVEKYITKCLESLINQTLKDIEIICIDDASTDSSLEILKKYQKKDCRIKILEQEHKGQGAARNKALNVALGKYIMVVDPDDWLEPNACEMAYNQIEKNKNDLVLFGYKNYFEKNGTFSKPKLNINLPQEQLCKQTICLSQIKTNFLQGGYSAFLICNKAFLNRYSIRYAENCLSEDATYTYIALACSKSFSVITAPIYIYRKRKDSAMTNTSRWKDNVINFKSVLDYLYTNNLIDPFYYYFSERSTNSLIGYYYRFTKKDPSLKKAYKKAILEYTKPLQNYLSKEQKKELFLLKYNLRSTVLWAGELPFRIKAHIPKKLKAFLKRILQEHQ